MSQYETLWLLKTEKLLTPFDCRLVLNLTIPRQWHVR